MIFSRSSRDQAAAPATSGAPRLVIVEGGEGTLTERLALSCPDFDLDQVHHVDDAIKGVVGPTIVVLGPDASNSSTLDRVEELRDLSASSDLTVVLAVAKITTPLLRRALRAGISDVVDIAVRHDLEDALRRVASRAAQRLVTESVGNRRGRVVAVFSPKGGVGTTTIAINLAARRGATPNVIVDTDLPFGDVAICLGVEPGNSLADATGSDLDLARLETLLRAAGGGEIRALVAPSDPARAEVITAADVQRALDLCREIANVVVVDTASAFDDITLGVLEMADEILIVTTPDVASVKNVKIALQTMNQLGIDADRVRVVINRVPTHPSLRVADIEKALSVTATSIPEDAAVGKATFHGVPVVTEAPRAPAAKALNRLADDLRLADISDLVSA
jgi:pilus assembly protein CpaE